MKTILVTGASGFIGNALCKVLSNTYRIIGLDRSPSVDAQDSPVFVSADIQDEAAVKHICSTYFPDVVIHCAGLAHQNFRTKEKADSYMRINCLAAEKLAYYAAAANPDLYFIFFSSVSVYGENHADPVVCETDPCLPTSHYAKSKLNAENRLVSLYDETILKQLDILRLASVYDNGWGFNLEKRVFAPKKMVYLRFGSGEQKLSALARQNLIDFIDFRLKQMINKPFCNIFNVCDTYPYSFNDIISVFQKTRYQPQRMVVTIPLQFFDVPTRLMGSLLESQSLWIRSFYYKLAKDLVFDNKKMMETGFTPKWCLKSVFNNNGLPQ